MSLERLHALGGGTTNQKIGEHLASMEAFTPRTNTWATMAPMPAARFKLAAAPDHDGRVYAIGGVDARDATAKVEVYTP